MTKSGFKNYLLEQEKLLTQIIELEVETVGSRKLAAKIGKPHNYFSVTMKLVKQEEFLPRKVKKLLEVASSIWVSDNTTKPKKVAS